MPGSIVCCPDISTQWMTAVAQADGLQAKHCPNEMLHSQNSEPFLGQPRKVIQPIEAPDVCKIKTRTPHVGAGTRCCMIATSIDAASLFDLAESLIH
ncbi:hypothetical protein GE21DRAFT_1012065, partial [Neurospora crassa]